jgi:hypothetical protein
MLRLRWAMTEREFQSRQRSRKRGGWSFVLFWGVLVFGGAMFAFDVCMGVFARHKPLVSSLDLYQIVGDFAAGLLCGFLFWLIDESRYRKALAQRPSNFEA